MSSKDIGINGEDLAVGYLLRNGCKIIERNWRCKFAELDIIAIDRNNTLLIIEVKSLKTTIDKNTIFCPEMHFNNIKRRKVKTAGLYYANGKKDLMNERRGFRVDLIAIEIDYYRNEHRIRHYKNVI